jgi:hypothetical protein
VATVAWQLDAAVRLLVANETAVWGRARAGNLRSGNLKIGPTPSEVLRRELPPSTGSPGRNHWLLRVICSAVFVTRSLAPLSSTMPSSPPSSQSRCRQITAPRKPLATRHFSARLRLFAQHYDHLEMLEALRSKRVASGTEGSCRSRIASVMRSGFEPRRVMRAQRTVAIKVGRDDRDGRAAYGYAEHPAQRRGIGARHFIPGVDRVHPCRLSRPEDWRVPPRAGRAGP